MATQVNYDLNINANDGVRTLSQIESELEDINQELKEVDVNSESFTRLSSRSQSLTSELQGVNKEIEGITSQDRQDQLQGTIDIFTGAIETVSGLSAVLGIQDERLERVLTRLIAVSQAANGIRTVTAGFIALTRATNATTAATTRFNNVSRRNILILVASLAAAGVAYIAFTEEVDESTDALERQQEQIQENISAQEAANRDVLESQRRAIDLLVVEGATSREVTMQRVSDAQDNLLRLDMEIDALEEANASKEEIAAAEMRRDDAIDANKEALHQDNLQRIRDEVAAEEAAMKRKEDITDAGIGLAGQLGDTLTTLAGENKALAITGLIVEQAAGVADIIVQTARANAKAVAASPMSAGQPFVAINTIAAGLSIAAAVGATARGIQEIQSSGGPAVAGVAGAGGATSVPFGPTIAIPEASEAPSVAPTAEDIQSAQQQQTVLLTPTSGEGSLQATMAKNERRQNKRRFGS